MWKSTEISWMGKKDENTSEKFLGLAQDGNEWKGLRQLLISLTGNVIGGG